MRVQWIHQIHHQIPTMPSPNEQIHQEILHKAGKSKRTTRANKPDGGEEIFSSLPYKGRALLADDDEADTAFAAIPFDSEPTTVKEALESDEQWDWEIAMDEEIAALQKNGTWEEVPQPKRKRFLKSRWVFKRKRNNNGNVSRYKARLVAKGYTQIPGVDYKETFAPVVSLAHLRLFLSLIAQLSLTVVQFDIKTAFLHGDLHEDIFMEAPERVKVKEGNVLKLKKSLYGLKQAPRMWNRKFNDFLLRFNLRPTEGDPCIYLNEDKTIFVLIYVDDGLIAVKNPSMAENLINHLKSAFEVTTSQVGTFLGLEISISDKGVYVSQKSYVDRILQRMDMQDCNPTTTPGSPEIHGQTETALGDITLFRAAVGALQYLACGTRPDISHAVSKAAQTACPTTKNWTMLKRIARYLKGSKDWGLRFYPGVPELIAYSDSDYANDPITRKSVTGTLIKSNGAPIVWRSQKQPIIALSTTEAEYIAASDTVKELVPLRILATDLGLMDDTPSKLYVDNQSTVKIANNDASRQRTKHIDVRNKWLVEQVGAGKIAIKQIPGELQQADILTKCLQRQKFEKNRAMIMYLIISTLASTQAFVFNAVSPVNYRETHRPIFNGMHEFNLSLSVLNPCETYFRNITGYNQTDSRIIEDCNFSYKKHVLDSMKQCSTRKLQINSNSIMTNKDHRALKKRAVMIGAAVVALGAGQIVIAGGSAYAVYRSEVNRNNINELKTILESQSKVINKGLELLNSTREHIKQLDSNQLKIIKKLDYLDDHVEVYPKVMALITEYSEKFQLIQHQLLDIDKAASLGQISTSLLTLTQLDLWNEPASRYSELRTCETLFNDGHLILKLNFIIPVRDLTSTLLRSDAFRIWKDMGDGRMCDCKGGSCVLFVQTSETRTRKPVTGFSYEDYVTVNYRDANKRIFDRFRFLVRLS